MFGLQDELQWEVKLLKAKILEFRVKLNKLAMIIDGVKLVENNIASDVLSEFDKHFDISVIREGKIK